MSHRLVYDKRPETLGCWLGLTAQKLLYTDAPRRTAEILACHVLGMDRIALIRDPALPLSESQLSRLDALVARRLSGEPVAYLTGWKEFYGRAFQVTPHTLIPRPETELLVDKALSLVSSPHVRFADLGTGSGCLAVTLAAERPGWTGTALDTSALALDCARRNALNHNTADRLIFLEADFTRFVFPQDALPDLIVSNPPYISLEEYGDLDVTVRDFEPRSALVPDDAGLSHLKAIVELAEKTLRSEGVLIMEHGATQGRRVREMCSLPYWSRLETGRDLAGLDRYLLATHC